MWLIAKGRKKEAEEILQRAAKWNNKSLPENCLSEAETKPMAVEMESDKDATTRTYTALDLFRTPNMRKISLCVSGTW